MVKLIPIKPFNNYTMRLRLVSEENNLTDSDEFDLCSDSITELAFISGPSAVFFNDMERAIQPQIKSASLIDCFRNELSKKRNCLSKK